MSKPRVTNKEDLLNYSDVGQSLLSSRDLVKRDLNPIHYYETPNFGEGLVSPVGQSLYTPQLSEKDIDKHLADPILASQVRSEDFEEMRSKDQSILGNVLYRAPVRTIAKAAGEIVKMAGTVGGLAMYGLEGLYNEATGTEDSQGNKWDEGWIFNNKFNNAINDAVTNFQNSESLNLKTYIPKEVEEGNLADNIFSSSFWATEGADGVGFLASMFVPGQVIKAAGIGGKLASAGSKILNRAGKLKAATNVANSGKFLDNTLAVGFNTFFESSAEASEIYNRVYEDLYNNQGYNKDVAKEIAADRSSAVFRTNMGILLLPNALENKLLFGKMIPDQNLLRTAYKTSSGGKLAKLGKAVVDTKLPQRIALTGAAEGLWEEGMQFATGEYYSGEEYEKGTGWLSKVDGVVNAYMDNFDTIDMQKSMALGAILGGGMAGIGSYREYKQAKDMVYGNEGSRLRGVKQWVNDKTGRKVFQERDAYVGYKNITDMLKISPDESIKETTQRLIDEQLISNEYTLGDIIETDSDGKIRLKKTNGLKFEYNDLIAEDLLKQVGKMFGMEELKQDAFEKNDEHLLTFLDNIGKYNAMSRFMDSGASLELFKKDVLNEKMEQEFQKRNTEENPENNATKAQAIRNEITSQKEQLAQKADRFFNVKQKSDGVINAMINQIAPKEFKSEKHKETYDIFTNHLKNALLHQEIKLETAKEVQKNIEDEIQELKSELDSKPISLNKIKGGQIIEFNGEMYLGSSPILHEEMARKKQKEANQLTVYPFRPMTEMKKLLAERDRAEILKQNAIVASTLLLNKDNIKSVLSDRVKDTTAKELAKQFNQDTKTDATYTQGGKEYKLKERNGKRYLYEKDNEGKFTQRIGDELTPSNYEEILAEYQKKEEVVTTKSAVDSTIPVQPQTQEEEREEQVDKSKKEEKKEDIESPRLFDDEGNLLPGSKEKKDEEFPTIEDHKEDAVDAETATPINEDELFEKETKEEPDTIEEKEILEGKTPIEEVEEYTGDVIISEEDVTNEVDIDDLRMVYDLYFATAGNTPQELSMDTKKEIDDSQVRWARFLDRHDMSKFKGKLLDFSSLPQPMQDFYGTRMKKAKQMKYIPSEAIFVFVTDKYGRFVSETGEVLGYNIYKLGEKQLSELVFTGLAHPDTIRPFRQADKPIQKKVREDYIIKLSRIKARLAERRNTFINFQGKSNGHYRDKEQQDGIDRVNFFTGLKNLNDYFTTKDITNVKVADLDITIETITQELDDNHIRKLNQGFIYVRDKRNDNLYHTNPRIANQKDINLILNALKYIHETGSNEFKDIDGNVIEAPTGGVLKIHHLIKNIFKDTTKDRQNSIIYFEDKGQVMMFGQSFPLSKKDGSFNEQIISKAKQTVDSVDIYLNVNKKNLDQDIFIPTKFDIENGVEGSYKNYNEFLLEKVLEARIPTRKKVSYKTVKDYKNISTQTEQFLPLKSNRYVRMDLTNIEEQPAPIDEFGKGKGKIQGDFNELDFLDIQPREATRSGKHEVWDREKEIAWFEQNIGVPVKIVDLIHRGYWGAFANSMVYLDKNAEVGTTYHEAFHAVSQLYLTEAERQAMYDEYRNGREISDNQVEEALAEQFRDYMLELEKPDPKTRVGRFFKELFDIIKRIFRNTEVRDSIFENISSGVYSYAPLRTSSATLYRSAYETNNIMYDSPELANNVVRNMGYYFVLEMKNTFGNYDSFYKAYNTDNEVLQGLMQGVKKRMIDMFSRQEDNPYAEVIISQFDEGGKNRELFENYLKRLGLGYVSEETLNEEEDEGDRVKDTGWDKGNKAFFLNPMTTSSAYTKLLMHSTPKIVVNEEGQMLGVRDSYGMNEMEKGETLMGRILEEVTGLKTLPALISKLQQISSEVDGLNYINHLLGINQIKVDGDLIMSGVTDMNRFIDLVKVLQSMTKSENEFSGDIFAAEDDLHQFIDLNTDSQYRVAKAKWRSNEGSLAVNNPTMFTQKDKFYTPKFFNDFMRTEALKLPGEARYEEVFRFLKALGITFSNEDAIIAKDIADSPKGKSMLTQTAYRIHKQIMKGQEKSILSSESNLMGRLKTLLKYEYATNKENDVATMFINKDNKSVYKYTNNTYLTTILDNINNFKSRQELFEHYPHLNPEVNPYTRNSEWLKLGGPIYNKSGVRVKKLRFQIVDFVGSETGDRQEFKDVDSTDQLRVLVNRLLNKKQVNLIKVGDSKIERFIELPSEGYILPSGRDFAQIMTGYLKDELMSSLAVLKGLSDKNQNFTWRNVSDPKKSARSGIVIDLIKYKLTKSDRFGKDMQDFVKKMNSLLTKTKAKSKKTTQELVDNLIEETNITEVFEAVVKEYAMKQTTTLMEVLQRGNIIVQQKNGKFKNNGLILNNKNEEVTANDIIADLRKFVINDMIGNIEQTKIFFGNPTQYGSADNFFKRTKAAQGPLKKAYNDQLMNDMVKEKLLRADKAEGMMRDGKPAIKQMIIDEIINSKVAQQLRDISESYARGEHADGNSWISLDFMREFLFRTGDWSSELEDLYQWEMQRYYGKNRPKFFQEHWGRKWDGKVRNVETGEEITRPKVVFNSLKPSYFGPYLGEQGHYQAMVKTGFAIMLPSIADMRDKQGEIMFPKYREMMETMRENQISIISMQSANKGATNKIQKTNVEDANTNTLESDPETALYQYLDWEFLGVQLDTGVKTKKTVRGGSQMAKHIFNTVLNKFKNMKDNPAIKAKINRLNALNKIRVTAGKKALLEKLGLDQENVNLEKVKRILADEARQRDVSDNVIDQIDKLDTNMGLDAMVDSRTFKYILMSLAHSSVINQSRAGQANYQVPSVGFELYGSEELNFYRKEDGTVHSMEVYLPAIYRNLEVDQIEDKRLLNIIGFRIPTQGLASIESIKIKGFLPETAGNIIVLPKEIVTKAGSDFDIDKLNLFFPNYYTDKKGKPRYIEGTYGDYVTNFVLEAAVKANPFEGYRDDMSAEELEKHREEYFLERDQFEKLKAENAMLEMYHELLLDPEIFEEFMKPLDDDFIKVASDKMKDLKGVESKKNFSILTDRMSLLKLHKDFTASVDGIGIAAVTSTFQVLAQMHNIRFNTNIEINDSSLDVTEGYNTKSSEHIQYNLISVPTYLNFISYNKAHDGAPLLGGNLSADGRSIQSSLSVVGNAVLDAIKDPYLSEGAGVDQDNLNIFLTLITAGVPVDDVIVFMNQPIIRDYRTMKKVNNSITNKVLKNFKNMSTVNIIQQLRAKYKADKYIGTGSSLPAKFKAIWAEPIAEMDIKIMQKAIKVDYSTNETFIRLQSQALSDYIRYEKMANVIKDTIQTLFTFDTKAVKTPEELIIKLHRAYETLYSGNLIGLDEALGRDTLVEDDVDSFSAPYYDNTRDLLEEYKPLFGFLKDSSEGNEAFNTLKDTFISIYNNPRVGMGITNAGDLLTKFVDGFYAFNIINGKLKINGETFIGDVEEEFNKLFVGNKKQESGIKVIQKLRNSKKYKSNAMLQALTPIIDNAVRNAGYDNLVLSRKPANAIESNELTYAWEELYNGTPNERKAAMALAKIAIMQDGLSASPTSFTSLMPAEIFNKIMQASQEAQTDLQNLDQYRSMFVEFLADNHRTNDLVPYSRKKSKRIYPITKEFVDDVTGAKTQLIAFDNKGDKVTISVDQAQIGKDYRGMKIMSAYTTAFKNKDKTRSIQEMIDDTVIPVTYDQDLTRTAKGVEANTVEDIDDNLTFKHTKEEEDKEDDKNECLSL